MPNEVDERYEPLLAAMSDLAALLARYGEEHWAKWVRRDRDLIERGQRHGLDSMISAFGGMGSLNDVVVHPLNGQDDQTSAVNGELRRLSSLVYSEATALRRELDRL